ncbi:MAG TPA: Xaa-Pro peptidase family protein, partial [Candidatus Thermoplasmatota archaeon]|nr:Xaa-Pro peptidase family protein [Candidatus Thermoplasmatota archaeon]
MRSRVLRIFQNVPQDVEAVVLANAVDPHLDLTFFYATDLVGGGLFERSYAVLTRDGRVEVLTSPLEEGLGRKAPEAEVTVYTQPDERDAWLGKRLAGARKIGFNGAEVVWSELETVRKVAGAAALVDVSQGLLRTRLVKDATELARMQRAADIASRVADEVPSLLAAGIKEYELAAEINHRMQRLGATGPSFTTIVAFGPNAAEPHYASGPAPLGRGQLALTDFGCVVDHYCSDITRTFGFGGAGSELRDMYDTVLRAQEAAIAVMRPGAKGVDVHAAAAKVIDATRWKGRFIHGTGHGLGLVVHDGGAMNSRYDLTLEEGMVLTVEPGVYV